MHRDGSSIFWREDTSQDPLTHRVIGAAIEVHKSLGPGLLESTYEECLCHELQLAGLTFVRQLPIPIQYKEKRLEQTYKLDIVIEEQLLVELKAVEKIEPIHEAQLLTYLKLSRLKRGLLLNFNVPFLKDGIKRMIH